MLSNLGGKMNQPKSVRRFEVYSILALVMFLVVSRFVWDSNTPARSQFGPDYLAYFKLYIPFTLITILCSHVKDKLSRYIYITALIYFMGSYLLDFAEWLLNNFQVGMIALLVPYAIFYVAVKNLFSEDASKWYESGENEFHKLPDQLKQLKFKTIHTEAKELISLALADVKDLIGLAIAKNKTLFYGSASVILVLIFSMTVYKITKPAEFNANQKIAALREYIDKSIKTNDDFCKVDEVMSIDEFSLKNGTILGLDLFSKHVGMIAYKKECRIKNKTITGVYINLYDKSDSEKFSKDLWTNSILVTEFDRINTFKNIAIKDFTAKDDKVYLQLLKLEDENKSLIQAPFVVSLGSDGFASIASDEGQGVTLLSSNQKELDDRKNKAKQAAAAGVQADIDQKINFIKKYEALYTPQDFIKNLFASTWSINPAINSRVNSPGMHNPNVINISCENFTFSNVNPNTNLGMKLTMPLKAISNEDIEVGNSEIYLPCKKGLECVNNIQNTTDNGRSTYNHNFAGIRISFYQSPQENEKYSEEFSKVFNDKNYDSSNLKSLSFNNQMLMLMEKGNLKTIINDKLDAFNKSCD